MRLALPFAPAAESAGGVQVDARSEDRANLLADSDNLPPPEVIAQEVVDDLEAALEQFRRIAEDLGRKSDVAGAQQSVVGGRTLPVTGLRVVRCTPNKNPATRAGSSCASSASVLPAAA